MPKLLVLKPKEVIKKLKKLGFIIDRQRGSHVIMYNPKTKITSCCTFTYKGH